MSEWQVSQDAEEAMADALATLAEPVERLVVNLHRDWVDVYVVGGGTCVARRCISRRPMDQFECDEEERGLSAILDEVAAYGAAPRS